MTIDEMKAAVEKHLVAAGLKLHPNGSGWFESPNGKWLCSFYKEPPRSATWMAMLDPAEQDFMVFAGCDTVKCDAPVPPADPKADENLVVLMAQQDQDVEAAKQWWRSSTDRAKRKVWDEIQKSHQDPAQEIASRFGQVGYSYIAILMEGVKE